MVLHVETLGKLESYHGRLAEAPAGAEKYLDPSAENHGQDGHVSLFHYPPVPLKSEKFPRK